MKKISSIPYERVVAFAAGPIAIFAGWAATWLEAHLGVLSTLGLSHDKTASAIVIGLTFLVGTVVTFLGHNKWLSNLTKWWEQQKPVPPPMMPMGFTGSGMTAGTSYSLKTTPGKPSEPDHGLEPEDQPDKPEEDKPEEKGS